MILAGARPFAWLLLPFAALASCRGPSGNSAGEPTGATSGVTTARGADFEIPVPSGWAPNPNVPVPPGAVALYAPRRARPGAFLGSVVVTTVPPSQPPVDPADPELCSEIARQTVGTSQSTVVSVGIVPGPFGPTCQFRTQNRSSGRRAHDATFTLMHGPRGDRALTCNYDPEDTAAQAACQQVIDGFRFDP